MEPGTLVVIAVVAVIIIGVVAFLAMRGRGEKAEAPAAPKKIESKERVTEKVEAAPAKAEPAKPAATKEAPAKAEPAAAKEAPKAEPAKPAAKEEPAKPAPAAPPPKAAEPEEEAPLPRPSRPPKDDVAALKKGLASTRGGFIARLARMLGRKKELDPALLDQLEEVLLTADLGPKTAAKLLEHVREKVASRAITEDDQVWEALRAEARTIVAGKSGGIALTKKPTVILVVGVNGVGKTTTIGKLASRYTQAGKKVVLAAGDTFRAAAVLQLEVWGRKTSVPVVKGKENADPGAVIFDAIKKARDEGADVVLADTAGRLHTKVPLMDELKKVGRTVEKALERPADEVLLVLDATNGQNAIQQAQMFRDALPVTGIVLTKLDGTAKGGVVLGIADEHGIPVRYIGIGERVEDLREFEPESFVEALFARPDDEETAATGAA